MQIDYDLDMKWNERLAEARDKAGMSNTDIVKACGVKPSSVTGWMTGKTVNIEAHNLLTACKLLNVSPFWIMSGDESPLGMNIVPESAVIPAMDVIRLIALYARATDEGKSVIFNAAKAAAKFSS